MNEAELEPDVPEAEAPAEENPQAEGAAVPAEAAEEAAEEPDPYDVPNAETVVMINGVLEAVRAWARVMKSEILHDWFFYVMRCKLDFQCF